MESDIETASDLVRSRTRIEILKRLRADDATRYDLRDGLDCARTTVDRNLDRLEEDGWIRQSNGEYAITTAGEIVLESAIGCLETVAAAERLQPILRWVPREEFDVDIRHLADAELTVASEEKPLAMVDRHAQAIKEAPNVRMVLPVVSPQPLHAQSRNNSIEDLSIEVVVTPPIAETFTTDPQFRDRIAELRGADAMEIFVTDESIPYYLGLLDGTVQIGVDEDGEPRGLLESEDEAVWEWAERKFASFHESAEPLEEWER